VVGQHRAGKTRQSTLLHKPSLCPSILNSVFVERWHIYRPVATPVATPVAPRPVASVVAMMSLQQTAALAVARQSLKAAPKHLMADGQQLAISLLAINAEGVPTPFVLDMRESKTGEYFELHRNADLVKATFIEDFSSLNKKGPLLTLNFCAVKDLPVLLVYPAYCVDEKKRKANKLPLPTEEDVKRDAFLEDFVGKVAEVTACHQIIVKPPSDPFINRTPMRIRQKVFKELFPDRSWPLSRKVKIDAELFDIDGQPNKKAKSKETLCAKYIGNCAFDAEEEDGLEEVTLDLFDIDTSNAVL